jgi:hypothetical protein
MLLKEQKEDVAQLVLLVKIIKEEGGNLSKERREHSQEKKIKGFMVGLKGEDNYVV